MVLAAGKLKRLRKLVAFSWILDAVVGRRILRFPPCMYHRASQQKYMVLFCCVRRPIWTSAPLSGLRVLFPRRKKKGDTHKKYCFLSSSSTTIRARWNSSWYADQACCYVGKVVLVLYARGREERVSQVRFGMARLSNCHIPLLYTCTQRLAS